MTGEQKQNVFVTFLQLLLNRGERVNEALEQCQEILKSVESLNPESSLAKVIPGPGVVQKLKNPEAS